MQIQTAKAAGKAESLGAKHGSHRTRLIVPTEGKPHVSPTFKDAANIAVAVVESVFPQSFATLNIGLAHISLEGVVKTVEYVGG